MKRLIYFMIFALLILHQDFWWWDDSDTLVFGFIPIGLAYHAMISIAAACLWALAVVYCWPEGIDDMDTTPITPDAPATLNTDAGGHP